MNMIRPKKRLVVGAREANQRFSHFMREAEAGCEVIITRNGKPSVRLQSIADERSDEAQQRAVAKLVKILKKGLPVKNIGRRLTRDEMHER